MKIRWKKQLLGPQIEAFAFWVGLFWSVLAVCSPCPCRKALEIKVLGVLPNQIHLIKEVICRVEIALVRVLCSELLPLAGSWQLLLWTDRLWPVRWEFLRGLRHKPAEAPPHQPVFAVWPRNGETTTEEPRAQVEGAVFMKDGSVHRQLLWHSQLKSSSQHCTPGQFLLKSCAQTQCLLNTATGKKGTLTVPSQFCRADRSAKPTFKLLRGLLEWVVVSSKVWLPENTFWGLNCLMAENEILGSCGKTVCPTCR